MARPKKVEVAEVQAVEEVVEVAEVQAVDSLIPMQSENIVSITIDGKTYDAKDGVIYIPKEYINEAIAHGLTNG